ncbi:MAG TPA: hypothetical protein DCX06_04150 [Opitutae bacterium]|nr:hypothetical protein [Opitutae bacterium]
MPISLLHSTSTKFTSLLYFAVFSCLVATSVNASEIQVGSSYADVIQILGEPDGELKLGQKSILTYGKAKIKLLNNNVVSVSSELEKQLLERSQTKSEVEANRDKGLVNFRGKWVTPNQRDAVLKSELIAKQKYNKSRSVALHSQQLWHTDVNRAMQLAKSTNKQLLLNFTGSDWCGWCIRLDNEVFSQQGFINYAKSNYILVKVDFPKRSTQTDQLRKQNRSLANKYRVRAYPTIVLVDSNGKPLARSGYVKGGPEAFLRTLR